jgi:hypothetical protein
VPALVRILHERFVLLSVHVNHIQRAGVFTGPASGAEFFVDDWRHTRCSLLSLSGKRRKPLALSKDFVDHVAGTKGQRHIGTKRRKT